MQPAEQSRPSDPREPDSPSGESLPQGAEAPPPGVRTMAIVRWSLVGLMALAAAAAWIHVSTSASGAGAVADAAFHCPMHPSVVQDQAGDCPICGMSLVPVAAKPKAAAAPAEGAPGHGVVTAAATTAAGQGAYWCPMHPEVASDDPEARCEKCGGMKLLPRDAGGAPPHDPLPGLAPVSLGPERVQLIGMRTAPAARRRLAPALRTVGFVGADESRLASVTVRFPGYVKDVRVRGAVARVRKGDVLASVYSPELIAQQAAFVNSVRWSKAAGPASPAQPVPASINPAEDPRRRLLLLGVDEQDLAEMERRLEPIQELRIRAPRDGWVVSATVRDGSYVEPGAELFQIADLSRVWVLADVFEHEMGRVRVGQRARLQVAAYPGRTFTGRVEFLYPALNPGTRTLQARMELANPDLALRPGMSGDVHIELGDAEVLAIPAEALVETGEAQYVFVAGAGGRIEPRRVEIGARADGHVQVLGGIAEGEAVVTTGNFLVDSESRLKAALESFAGQQR